MKKRGQTATSAATLVAIIAGLIILYVLFLPPEERAILLDDQPRTVPGGSQGGVIPGAGYVPIGKGVIFEDSPGKIDYTALGEFEHQLPAFTLFKVSGAQVLDEINPFFVKNGWFDKRTFNTTFEIPDLRNTDNVALSYTLTAFSGVLSIKLNGIPIYEYEEKSANAKPVKLNTKYLQSENVLDFSVDSPGVNFWKTNEYSFTNMKITGDVTDRSKEKSLNTFFITESEGENLERAILKFNPDCQLGNVGTLTIEINDRLVYQGIPDCGQLNFIEMGPEMINIGKNKIEFMTDQGSYLVDQIVIKTELKTTAIPIYYFELDPKLFTHFEDFPEEECGKIDGICPSFCDEDSDIDCCFTEYDTPFWCDMITKNKDDRCVGYVEEADCNRCPAGYEDDRGRAPDACEVKCGDDEDNKCPAGCNADYDKDCCFDQTGDQYWCNELPTNGLSFSCVNEVSRGQCEICPTGYEAENGGTVCLPTQNIFLGEELRPEYSVLLTLKFTNDLERKEADLFINGHLTHMQTRGNFYQKDISAWIEPDTNSIEIKPYSVLNIRTLQIQLV